MSQRLISGLGSISKLMKILEDEHAKNILVVTGKKSYFKSGSAEALKPIFDKFNVFKFNDFEINPKIEDAIKGTKIARTNNIDTIISIGGGSVIDIAKLILAFFAYDQDFKKIINGIEKPKFSQINHISIPTTAGTGSESTKFAVVYLDKIKYSVAADFLIPKTVILDGTLCLSNSPSQKAFNGLDALAQAIESHWACGSTKESKFFSRKAIPILFKELPKIVSGKAKNNEFQDFFEASNMAGRAINISKTTSPHAFSYAFTSKYFIPHGQAVWLTLPKIFEIHKNALSLEKEKIVNYDELQTSISEIIDLLGISQNDIANNLKKFVCELGLEPSMEKLGISTREKRQEIAKNVNLERLKNNPVLFSKKDICDVFNL